MSTPAKQTEDGGELFEDAMIERRRAGLEERKKEIGQDRIHRQIGHFPYTKRHVEPIQVRTKAHRHANSTD